MTAFACLVIILVCVFSIILLIWDVRPTGKKAVEVTERFLSAAIRTFFVSGRATALRDLSVKLVERAKRFIADELRPI